MTAKMTVNLIETTEQHLKDFAVKHPMEVETTSVGDGFARFFSRREIFAYKRQDLPFVLNIDVTGIKRALSLREIPFEMYEGLLDQARVDHTVTFSGIEEAGVERVSGIDRPGIAIWWGGNHTMIDGNHRLVRRWRDKKTNFQFALIPAERAFAFMAPEGIYPESMNIDFKRMEDEFLAAQREKTNV